MGLSQDRAVKALLGERAKLCAGVWGILHDTHAAEDVFQDVIVKALHHLDEFHHESRLLSWSRTTARNRAIDIVRRRNSKVLILGEEALDRIQNNLVEQPHELISARTDALHVCIDKLPVKSRRLIDLRYKQGLGGREVAEKISKKLDAVYQSLSRIHRQLKKCIESRLATSGIRTGASITSSLTTDSPSPGPGSQSSSSS